MKLSKFFSIFLFGCTLTLGSGGTFAASKDEIDANVKEATSTFYKHTSAGKELAGKASGMLVFPKVVKAGLGIGGEYGEGPC